MSEDVDAMVVGAGPAGLAAALALAERGLDLRLIDEAPAAGGQIWRGAVSGLGRSDGGAREALAVLSHPRVRHAAGATVVDASAADGSASLAWLPPRTGGGGLRETRAHALVLATGAMERPVLFPGATLPGVMGVGAVQVALKQAGLVPRGPGVVLAGQGPLLLLALGQILDGGGCVDAVLDLAPRGASRRAAPLLPRAAWADAGLLGQGAGLLARARRRGVVWHRDVARLRAEGDERIEAVAFEARGRECRLPCRLLAVHDGVLPNVQLARLLGLDHEWREDGQAFAPVTDPCGRSSDPAVWVAGDGAGVAGGPLAGLSGRLAGLDAARALLGHGDEGASLRRRVARRRPARAFLDRLYRPLPVSSHADDGTVVCRCEAVTLKEVRRAVAAGATGPNRVKTFTRCGMGACQGRFCSNALTRILAETTGASPAEIGALRIRPPLKPVAIADYLGIPHPAEASA